MFAVDDIDDTLARLRTARSARGSKRSSTGVSALLHPWAQDF
jgi:hypothetical protein